MSKSRALPQGLKPATLPDAESATYIGVSLNKFRRMREDGLMPPARKVDGRNLNIIAELDKAIAALPINDGGRE
jgi:hypothetical protein